MLPVCVLLATLQPSLALTESELLQRIRGQKGVPAGTNANLSLQGNVAIVELWHYPSNGIATRKTDALLISRTLVHADPGSICGVVVRYMETDPGSFTEVMISNREITGADAGILGINELMQGVELVAVLASDPADTRFSKYFRAGDNELLKRDYWEADYFFRQAFRQSAQSARSDSRFLTSLVNLASAYQDRGDVEESRRADQLLGEVVSDNLGTNALGGARELYSYWTQKNDYSNALKVADKIVAAQKAAGRIDSPQFAQDLANLANCHRNCGQISTAKKELELALLIQRNKLGEHHPALASVMESLGDCYTSEGGKSKAYDFYKQAKLQCDYAIVSRNKKERLVYEMYQGIVKRLNLKMQNVSP